MNLLFRLLLTASTYAAAFGGFTAIVCYRANPRRAVNRVVALTLLNLAMWQLSVAFGHATGDIHLWANVCLYVGGFAIVDVFLLHDACVYPHAVIWERMRRTRSGWLVLIVHILGGLCKLPPRPLPPIYPYSLRVLALSGLILGVIDLRKQRRAARAVNSSEILFFGVTGAFVGLWATVFLLLPGSISVNVNTALAFVFFGIVLMLLLTEHVFDVAGTAKIASCHVIRSAFLFILLIPALTAVTRIIPREEARPWLLLPLAVLFASPLAAASDWLTRRFFRSFETAPTDARNQAMRTLETADSESAVVQKIAALAKRYLGGLDVKIEVDDGTQTSTHMTASEVGLASSIKRRWLSPEIAVRKFRGDELDEVLRRFTDARLGALIKHSGRKITVLLFISQRGGGTKPIVSAELEFLYELATVAGTSIDRLRALDECVRARGLAHAGRVAADFSHSARNQISAIQALVEAVNDGQEAQLSREYREAVYKETVALATTHAMAAEIERLAPAKLELRPQLLRPLLEGVAMTWERMLQHAKGRLDLEIADRRTAVRADERLLRQVCANLLRNAVQACADANVLPVILIRVENTGATVLIDIIDNGPGVSTEIHDRIFTPWATTKADGTGIGLSFCLQAIRSMGGELTHVSPRGAAGAHFRIRLPSTWAPASYGDDPAFAGSTPNTDVPSHARPKFPEPANAEVPP